MITVILGSLSAIFVIAAFVTGLLIGTRLQNKSGAVTNKTERLTALSPDEIALQKEAMRRLKEDNEAFARMMGYNQSMAYKMGNTPSDRGG